MKSIRNLLLILIGIQGVLAANAERYTIEIGQFEKLKVNGNFSLVYKNLPDSTGMAFYEAPAEQEGMYEFATKNDGTLKVEPTEDKWSRDDLPVIHVYSDFLYSVESFSNLTVEIGTLAPCASFNVSQIGNGTIFVEEVKCNILTASIKTGNGSIYVNGSCITANLKMVGAGLISADRLQAETVKCSILGTGSIGCWPIDNLYVSGLGSTKIYYKGKPNISKKGGGKLFELPSEFDEESLSKNAVEVPTFQPAQSSEEESNEYIENKNLNTEEVISEKKDTDSDEVSEDDEDDEDDENDENDENDGEDDEEDDEVIDDDNYQTVVTEDD